MNAYIIRRMINVSRATVFLNHKEKVFYQKYMSREHVFLMINMCTNLKYVIFFLIYHIIFEIMLDLYTISFFL